MSGAPPFGESPYGVDLFRPTPELKTGLLFGSATYEGDQALSNKELNLVSHIILIVY